MTKLVKNPPSPELEKWLHRMMSGVDDVRDVPRRTDYPPVMTQRDVAEFLDIGYRGVMTLRPPLEPSRIAGKWRWLQEDVLEYVKQQRAA